jgi:superfamily II DNA helicase RecQ
MKCRTMGIRITQPFAATDEEAASEFLSSVKVRKVTAAMLEAPEPAWSVVVFYDEAAAAGASAAASGSGSVALDPSGEPGTGVSPHSGTADLSDDECRLVESIKTWRSARAAAQGVPPYCIAHNSSIEQIARDHPKALTDFAGINGFGPSRIEKYAGEILEILDAQVTAVN